MSNYCLDFLPMFSRNLKKLSLPHFIVSEDALNALLQLMRLDEMSIDRLSFDDESSVTLGKYLERLNQSIIESKSLTSYSSKYANRVIKHLRCLKLKWIVGDDRVREAGNR